MAGLPKTLMSGSLLQIWQSRLQAAGLLVLAVLLDFELVLGEEPASLHRMQADQTGRHLAETPQDHRWKVDAFNDQMRKVDVEELHNAVAWMSYEVGRANREFHDLEGRWADSKHGPALYKPPVQQAGSVNNENGPASHLLLAASLLQEKLGSVATPRLETKDGGEVTRMGFEPKNNQYERPLLAKSRDRSLPQQEHATAARPLSLFLQNEVRVRNATDTTTDAIQDCGGEKQPSCNNFNKILTYGYSMPVWMGWMSWMITGLCLILCCCCCLTCFFHTLESINRG